MVYRFQLTNGGIIDILDIKYVPTKRTELSLNLGIYEVSHINKSLEYILPDIVKVSITIDDIRLKSNIKTNQTLIISENSFFILYWALLDHILILYTI